jgi:hypothetical protein
MMNPTDDFLAGDTGALVEAELDKGERITWIGRPIAGRMARSAIPMVVLGVPFTAFAVFWMAMASGIAGVAGSGVRLFFVLWGIPFVLVGLGMLASPFWMYRKALGTVYAITDRRALIIERGITGRSVVRTFDPAGLGTLSRVQDADGSGSLVFRREFRPAGRRGRFVEIGFLAVPDVREVEDRIRQLAAQASPRGPDRP